MGSLQELCGAARAAWPGVVLSDEDFGRHLERHVPGMDADALCQVHASDLFLACACARGDPAALRHFDRLLQGQAGPTLVRFAPAPAFIDEVLQELRQRLLVAAVGTEARIAAYSGRGPLGGWLRVAMVRAALNLRLRRQDRPAADAGAIERAPAAPLEDDTELGFIKARYRGAFREAVQAALAGMPAEQRSLLRHHFLDGLTLEEVAAEHRLSRATVVRRIAAARRDIMAQIERLMTERLGLAGAELRSLIGLLRSRLDVSVSHVMRSGR